MGYIRPNGTAADGEPVIDSQESKYFTKFPQTAKFMKWEIQGNCFSTTLQRLGQTVATAVAAIFDLIALPFRAALFLSFGLCADQVTISKSPASENAPSSESTDSTSSNSDESSSGIISLDNSTEIEFSRIDSEKFIEMLIEADELSDENADLCVDTESFQFHKSQYELWKGVRRKLKDKLPDRSMWKADESRGIFHEIVRDSYIEKYRLKELMEKFINPISAEEFNHGGLYPFYLKLCKDIQKLPNIHNLEWYNDGKSVDDILEIITFISYYPVVKHFYHHILPNGSRESDDTSSYESEWESSSDSEAPMLIPGSPLSKDLLVESPRAPSSPSSNDDIDEISSPRRANTPPLSSRKEGYSITRTASYPFIDFQVFAPKQASKAASKNIAGDISFL